MIIGIAGKSRAGKDLLASIMGVDGWKHLAFADELKRRVREDLGLTLAHTNGGLKENPTPFKNLNFPERHGEWRHWSPREIMIEYGKFYRQFDPLFWVRKTFEKINGTTSDENYVISDVRFANEADAIKNARGALIRLERHESRDALVSEATKLDLSETALDNYKGFDFKLPAELNYSPVDLLDFWSGIKEAIRNRV